MIEIKTTAAQKSDSKNRTLIKRKIGTTVYEVSLFFSDKSKENLNDKIMRLIKSDPQISTL